MKGGGVKTSTNLLLWVLHSSHGPWGPTLDADWIPLWAWGAVGASWVRAALLRLRMRVTAHPIQLRSLHHHRIHWAALGRNKQRHRLNHYLLQRQKFYYTNIYIKNTTILTFDNIKNTQYIKISNHYVVTPKTNML